MATPLIIHFYLLHPSYCTRGWGKGGESKKGGIKGEKLSTQVQGAPQSILVAITPFPAAVLARALAKRFFLSGCGAVAWGGILELFPPFSSSSERLFLQHLISVLAWGEPSCVLSPLPSPWASSCPGRGLSRALILPCSFLFLFPLLPPIPQPCSAVYHMKP